MGSVRHPLLQYMCWPPDLHWLQDSWREIKVLDDRKEAEFFNFLTICFSSQVVFLQWQIMITNGQERIKVLPTEQGYYVYNKDLFTPVSPLRRDETRSNLNVENPNLYTRAKNKNCPTRTTVGCTSSLVQLRVCVCGGATVPSSPGRWIMKRHC